MRSLVTIVRDNDAGAWVAELPLGWRFVSGTHYLVEPWGPPGRSPAAWIREAKVELLRRHAADDIEQCPDDCDCCD